MTGSWDVALLLVGLISAATAGGAFFTFSNFVMPALSTMAPSAGADAMQAINRAAPNPLFAAVLVLGVLAGAPVLITELDTIGDSSTSLTAAAVALSATSLVITATRNVPKNNRLERLSSDPSAAAAYWQRYVPTWTLDNTIRCVASLASAVMYALSLRGR